MESKQPKRLSRAAIAEYRAKLDQLKNVTRLEVAQQIKEARAFGDISENAEYDAAMDNQARIEYEIAQLEDLLANVEEIDEDSLDFSTVNVGGRVRIQSMEDDCMEEYDIVSTSEVEPFAKKIKLVCIDDSYNSKLGFSANDEVEIVYPAKISNESPVGKALIGRKTGETVDVQIANKIIHYKVMDIVKIPETPIGRVVSENIIG